MLNDKEKLIEFVIDACDYASNICAGTDCNECVGRANNCLNFLIGNTIADALIANGVTVREKGEWDDSGRYQFMDGTKAIRCTECGCALTEIEYQKYFYNFCPVCGADMRGDSE